MDQIEKTVEDFKLDLSIIDNIVLEASNLRRKLGLSQSELAERMGTKQPVISRFENFGREPSITFLQTMAQALGTELVLSIDGSDLARISAIHCEYLSEIARQKGTNVSEILSCAIDSFIQSIDVSRNEPYNIVTFDLTKATEARPPKGMVFKRTSLTISPEFYQNSYSDDADCIEECYG